MLETKSRERLLFAIFALSGAAALIYQVSWQRLLFGAFGVDVESITVIVSTFMLGLGCGALIGGRLADRFGDNIIDLFVGAELAIGLFGLVSPWLISWVGGEFVQSPLPLISVANFILLLLPTTCMGATLPMLVAYTVRTSGNVGVSVGALYETNTLGAAIGAFLSGLVLFVVLSLDRVIFLAALLNFTVATAAFFGVKQRRASEA
jgi:predicted membrane-bound spermidine synthase